MCRCHLIVYTACKFNDEISTRKLKEKFSNKEINCI